jgi:hypothetical protein
VIPRLVIVCHWPRTWRTSHNRAARFSVCDRLPEADIFGPPTSRRSRDTPVALPTISRQSMLRTMPPNVTSAAVAVAIGTEARLDRVVRTPRATAVHTSQTMLPHLERFRPKQTLCRAPVFVMTPCWLFSIDAVLAESQAAAVGSCPLPTVAERGQTRSKADAS